MSYPVWPSDLPRPERSSYQLQPQDARRKRGFEAGPPGYRRRFSAVAKLVSLSLILTANQRAVFDNFYGDDCAQGAALFWMPDATRDGQPLLTHDGQPLLTHDGTPILLASRWLCAWGDTPPIETIQGIEFRKQFQVVVMP
ncbi:hypothetical protein [Rhodobacter capsulatus]|jgi:hypothetical protein|uniref:Uncharacterized protein n=1 Tax=Rhodobacter capsulatus (strain ATCC BAA-309 / NBRC 16581 / SB1003) TaxID=272942 RepID=D5AQS4_RHOCB|nr:hypothetical protein [Rhodobacter capsulatus]YP_004934695.1 virion structural protein [Rhodobacter phage RcapMu]AFK66560.1 hypothetical protein RHZG_00054 [Rhodobacter phage RcNL1]ADE84730.1 conserved hypothetical protein [Rhodobacter capsulatus SB 1003]AER29974.1 hypothetical protein RcapMu52 [Rhodobacter phage RcapMu]ETD02201.1 hypothetical protein U714_06040 [Rhodobacter capsulatus DE442]ETD78285.1 hypothetical protein U717_06045 [Rhodobacter capsulatus R121]